MGISLVVLNIGKCFQGVVTYSFSNKLNEQQLTETILEILKNNELFQKPFSKTHIIWAFPQSIILPPGLVNSDNNADMLNLVYGDARKAISMSDFLYKHNLHHIYRIPEKVAESFTSKFPYAAQTHQYSLVVNREMNNAEDELFVVFYTHSLTLMLCREGRLQVIQNFTFDSPEDTAYQMLNVCKSFDVQPNKVKLHISGMIDENSNLYSAIYKYFLYIEFDKLPGDHIYAEEIKEYPPHFFSHLFLLATCV